MGLEIFLYWCSGAVLGSLALAAAYFGVLPNVSSRWRRAAIWGFFVAVCVAVFTMWYEEARKLGAGTSNDEVVWHMIDNGGAYLLLSPLPFAPLSVLLAFWQYRPGRVFRITLVGVTVPAVIYGAFCAFFAYFGILLWLLFVFVDLLDRVGIRY